MTDLDLLMALIAREWKCDETRYPELAGMTIPQKRNFLLKHSVLHITKTNGKLATICEDFDHNGELTNDDEMQLQVIAVKMFINALKLAEGVEMSPRALLARAPNYVQ
ncbi:MAG TPA: hypothetical protein VM103_01470 [Candidatus Paceibacterota bacterium]|nr:hypothetical protein [Candidatus Paceibacterota bacterium]